MIFGIEVTVPLFNSVEDPETKQLLSRIKTERSVALIAIESVWVITLPSYLNVIIFGFPNTVDLVWVIVIRNCPFLPPRWLFITRSLDERLKN